LRDITPPERQPPPSPGRIALSPAAAILLAIAIGLCGGFLDVVLMILRRSFWSDVRHIESGRDFVWSVPVVHAALLLIPGALLAAVSRLLPGRVSLRVGSWLLATLALWSALLRAPLYGAATLILAAGLTRPIGASVAGLIVRHPRRARYGLAGLLGATALLAALTTGRQVVREHRAVAALPAPPSGALNLVLIVWDTVRASSLSLYGYPRDTTPNLSRWARSGVRYAQALAPANWTFPSHSCFFTGRWPYQLNAHGTDALAPSVPTLAKYLSSRGYQTAGFVANTSYCSYETGLDRGFAHFEDYPLTPRHLLGRTVPGSWILNEVLSGGDSFDRKWVRLQSRDANGINEAFFDWLSHRRRDRPFFAFLNHFDAHDPYIPPAGYAGRFGIRPRTARDYQLLTDFAHLKTAVAARDVVMARDCYDDCIAFLDDQLGRLLDELLRRGILDRTLVIITSDHGESFGTHGLFGHGGSLYLDEIGVPLVILSPGAPANRIVPEPVSLRDLPATVVDLLGLSDGSPFPGHSLAALWRPALGPGSPEISPAFSELAHPAAFQSPPRHGTGQPGLQMSLVTPGRHYIRDGMGAERLYDLRLDPNEFVDQISTADGNREAGVFRKRLLKVLSDDPGPVEVERAYLQTYRQRLKSAVGEDAHPRSAMTRP
jgi:arylsulfatase A-like enzyme